MDCIVGMYGDTNTRMCYNCSIACKTCYSNGSSSCLTCSYGYLQNGTSCTPAGDAQVWNQTNITNGWTAPVDGDNVTIPSTMYVLLTSNTSKIDTLIIDGILTIDDTVVGTINLYARRIFIRAGNFHYSATSS
jgi:hypothetical protein